MVTKRGLIGPAFTVGLAFTIGAGAPAFASDMLTLDEARQVAVQNHPAMRSADFAQMAAEQEITIARSDALPQIRADALGSIADAGATRIGAPPDGINNPSVFDHGSVGLGVEQLVTDFGKTRDLVEASRLELEAQRGNSRLERDALLVNVTRAYIDVLRGRALLIVANNTLKARRTLLDQVSALRKSGLKSDLDVSVTQQLVNDANLLLLKARNAQVDAAARLSEALGYSEGRAFTLKGDVQLFPPPENFEALVRMATTGNPELGMLEAKREAADKRAEAAGKAWYPTVKAIGFAGLTPLSRAEDDVPSDYAAAGLTVSIPIFTGGRLAAEERQQNDVAGMADADLNTRFDLLLRDLRISFDNTKTAYENIRVTTEALSTAQKTVELMQTSYRVGRNSIVDLSQAQLSETQAEIVKIDATYEYLVQYALLRFTVGNDHVHWERENLPRS